MKKLPTKNVTKWPLTYATTKNRLTYPNPKGHTTVVMDRTDYINKANKLLQDNNTYKKLDRDPTKTTISRINKKTQNAKRPTKTGQFNIFQDLTIRRYSMDYPKFTNQIPPYARLSHYLAPQHTNYPNTLQPSCSLS